MRYRLSRVSVCSIILMLCALALSACERDTPPESVSAGSWQAATTAPCDPDNGGLILPAGFCAAVVADNLGFVRHIAVSSSGVLYAALRNVRLNLGGILALGDTDGDGRMDHIEQISDIPGLGIAIRGDELYFGSDSAIYRFRLASGRLQPLEPPVQLVTDLPDTGLHAGKALALDGNGGIYVNIGAASNACQTEDRVAGSLGLDPCPELETRAGIWRFATDRTGQTQADGEHYARGIRNAYAIAWNEHVGALYVVQHGRDQLHELWPDRYSAEQGAELPAEEFLQVERGSVYGWPYCYFNPSAGRMELAPEYGGDGRIVDRCADFPRPILGFPAHYSPNAMVFYEGRQFPERYRHGAFIAFHGSYNRGKLGQAGYQVVFVPFMGERPAGAWEVFADGFAGTEPVATPADADFRPTGLALGPDGSLYVADSVQGRIWRIRYVGSIPRRH